MWIGWSNAPAHTRAKAQKLETRARSRMRRQGINELAHRDHAGLDRETLSTARQIYVQQLLRAKGGPFANETLAGAAFALCVMRATGEIATVREFDAQCRGVLGLGLVPTAEERAAVQEQMKEARVRSARFDASYGRGTGGW